MKQSFLKQNRCFGAKKSCLICQSMANLLHVLGKRTLYMHPAGKMCKGDVYEAAFSALLLPQCLSSIVPFHYSMLLKLPRESPHSQERQSMSTAIHLDLVFRHKLQ